MQASNIEAKIQEQSVAELAGLKALEHDLKQRAKVQHMHKLTNVLIAVASSIVPECYSIVAVDAAAIQHCTCEYAGRLPGCLQTT